LDEWKMRRYNIKVGQHEYVIDVQEMSAHRFRVWIGDRELDVHIAGDHDIAEATITPEIVPNRGDGEAIERPAMIFQPAAPDTMPVTSAPQSIVASPGAHEMVAPMPGTILSISVALGDRVRTGQALMVLEAMKMKNTLRSPLDGTIAEIIAAPGQIVKAGSVLMRFADNSR
jgi:biotin carboxyl carrier protein